MKHRKARATDIRIMIALTLALFLAIAKTAFAGTGQPEPSWFEHKDLMNIIIIGLLAYVWLTVKKSYKKIINGIDRNHATSQKIKDVIIIMATEHKKNHCDSTVDIKTLMDDEDRREG